MKKVILMVLFGLSLVSNSFGQNIKSINGIGIFKLGSNISIIDSFGEIAEISDSYSEASYYEYGIIEYMSDTNSIEQVRTGSLINSESELDQRCRIFKINKSVRINDEIKLENLRLIFLCDTLVSIECDYSSELEEALNMKYGKIETKITKTPHKYTRTINGSQITLTDERYEVNRSNSLIECRSVLCSYYSGSIEAKYFSYFILQNKKAMKSIKLETSKYKKRLLIRIEERKKKNLKDL
jgi:hypothetical protein